MTRLETSESAASPAAPLSWLQIFRLGLVMAALGAVVVLTTTTLNRVMIVELGLAASLPAALVTFYHALEMLRPRWGYGADMGGRRTPWIVGGMAVLASGGALAALAAAWMETAYWPGLALAIAAFALIGIGVGAAGTALLTLLARETAPARRGVAGPVLWIMMIVGFVITTITVGKLLDPFSFERLVKISAAACAIAFAVAALAVWGVEPARPTRAAPTIGGDKQSFRAAFAEIWAEPQARRFTIFVFVAMLAYEAQDLILEPFAALVFGMTPGQSTQLAGAQYQGALLGMLLFIGAGWLRRGHDAASAAHWAIGGCVASALAHLSLVAASVVGPGYPLWAGVFALGCANGAFAAAALGSMMTLADAGRADREGVRLGLWGAAQAIAFATGGFLGAVLVDLVRAVFAAPAIAYGSVFALEAALFLAAAVLAIRVGRDAAAARPAIRSHLVAAE